MTENENPQWQIHHGEALQWLRLAG